MHREDDYPRSRQHVLEVPGRPDAIEPAHAHVHHHHVGLEGRGKFDGFRPLVCLPDNLEVRFAGHAHPQALAHTRFVVNKEEANRQVHHPSNSTGASTAKRPTAGWFTHENFEGMRSPPKGGGRFTPNAVI